MEEQSFPERRTGRTTKIVLNGISELLNTGEHIFIDHHTTAGLANYTVFFKIFDRVIKAVLNNNNYKSEFEVTKINDYSFKVTKK